MKTDKELAALGWLAVEQRVRTAIQKAAADEQAELLARFNAPLTHEERLAIINAPLPQINTHTGHTHAGTLGERVWNLQQLDGERDAW
jgi:hypothetical protein